MGRMRNGWELTKQSFRVIKEDKEILIFPILSGVLTIGFAAIFFFFFLLGEITLLLTNQNLANIALWLWLFFFLLGTYFIAIFFQAAIITSATIRFSGNNPTLGDGLKQPMKKIHKIFIWAIISAIVGILLKIIENLGRGRSRGTQAAASIASALLGLAWALLTFFTVPILLFENTSTFGAIKRSKDLFIRTWGENATAQFTIGGIFFLIALPFIALFILAFFSGSISFLISSLIILLLVIAMTSVLSTSVNGILKAALYKYATSRKMPSIYSPESVQNLFTKPQTRVY